MSLTGLTERIHSDGAIPPGRKCFLLMFCTHITNESTISYINTYVAGYYPSKSFLKSIHVPERSSVQSVPEYHFLEQHLGIPGGTLEPDCSVGS